MDLLASAVVDVASHAVGQGWGQPPRLWALARKKTLSLTDQKAAGLVPGQPDDALIPIEQDPLPPGEPEEVLAAIDWPDEVDGCVLVTELFVLPPEAEQNAPGEPAAAELWAARQPGRRPARLAVGVLRDGSYTCCLQLRDEEGQQDQNEVTFFIDRELADDLVTALLATFVPVGPAGPETSPAVSP